ncbi:MAG: amidohydrolase family protein, partial [Candidatus Latescibacterota bacterium]
MYDVVIRNGRLIDGTGSPWFRADVAVSAGRIARIGNLPEAPAARILDAAGCLVAPGLIDIHTHSDLTLLVDRRAASTLAQGITTQVVGNCGVSGGPTCAGQPYYGPLDPAMTRELVCDWVGFGEYLERLEQGGLGTNVASLVGHGNLRAAVMGYDNRPSTPV